ncbi:MAG: hypothetical protein VZR00_07530 [Lachnospiraceae bacterium]|nr:hypothetical protein [Lachnospiraceae bacterium]
MTEVAMKSEGILYFDADQLPCKGEVLKRMGVCRDTFAGNMISRLYDYYFAGATNFRKEYKRFYRREFSSLTDFIEEHYNLDHSRAEILSSKNYSMKNCIIYNIEQNIEILNYDKDFKQKFSEAIGGLVDEDPDGIYYQ